MVYPTNSFENVFIINRIGYCVFLSIFKKRSIFLIILDKIETVIKYNDIPYRVCVCKLYFSHIE